MFERLKIVDKTSFNSNLNYLWILHADKVPPHVGISSKGNYFSLKYNGKDVDLPVSKVMELVERKAIKTLAVQLKSTFTEKTLAETFKHFERTFSNEITCLAPIEMVLDKPKFDRLESLLLDLEVTGELGEMIGFNVEPSFQGLPAYTTDDIHRRLQFLENVNE